MIETLYYEEDVSEHPVARRIRDRFSGARQISIERYSEVFNRKAQNFRLQKSRPALILARKHDSHVLPVPPSYGVGASRNFYFSHMLNCVYDCRYCFLQGMYRSANYVVFVNYEDFASAIEALAEESPDGDACFFSGYDCDSLALEPVTGFVQAVLPVFERHPGIQLELRTKSTQVRTLLNRPAMPNVIVAFSFTPSQISASVEHKVPGVERRIRSMAEVARLGWPIGLRFDPLIYDPDYQRCYRELFERIAAALGDAFIHSVSLGPFRLPRTFFRTVERRYPDAPLLAGNFVERGSKVSYPPEIEHEMVDFCTRELSHLVSDDRLYRCEL